MILQDNELETASLEMLMASCTEGQVARAEAGATAAMSRITDPVCGAREIVMAQLLRRELRAERKGIEKLMASIAR